MFLNKKISLVIPTKNEEKNLSLLLTQLPEFIDEIIVVDASSTDGTYELALNSDKVAKTFKQKGFGKGSALCLGAQKASGDFIIFMDSDGSMSPKEFPVILNTLIAHGADIVKGSRYLKGAGSDDLSHFRSIGNKGLLLITNLFYKCNWTELAYGYFALKASTVSKLDLNEFESKVSSGFIFPKLAYGQGFEIEAVIFCRAVRRNLKVLEFPSHETKRWNGTSNLKAIPDGFRVLSAIILERIRSERRFT
jgi:glycosyltransferase involved in cell wall biosynthesis